MDAEKNKDSQGDVSVAPAKIKKPNKRMRNVIIICCVVLAFFLARGLLKKKPSKELPPRPVEIGLAIAQDAADYIESFGNLYPPNDVNIQSQVTGAIKEVNFQEGREVKAGDLLFTIDPSTYQAQLDQANAALSQDAADLQLRQITYDRNKKLFDKQLLSQQDLDTYASDLAVAQAKVKQDYAEIELAKINLNYCYIRSPVDGRTGKHLVDLGNIVTANNGPTLVNIKTIDSLYVDFTIPERELSVVREAMEKEKLKVEVFPEDQEDRTYSGQLELLDNAVNNTTGTVLLRAEVPNKERELWPGQFVTLRLILKINKAAVLAPYDAVQLGQQGAYLFVVTPDNKADLRSVKTAERQKDYIVIEEGVQAGERVVTSGQMGLSPGASVVDVSQLRLQEEQASTLKKGKSFLKE
jgi:multidrug efflux system membrane fusion protein